MGLPKIELPLFEAKIASSKEKVKFRPFTVKEEKILLMAQETNEPTQVLLAMKQIVNNCCLDIDAETLPLFDLEYLLLHIRGKSVNNMIQFTITDPETEKPVDCEIDIDQIELRIPEGHSKEIEINDDTRMIMRYPKLDQVSVFIDAVMPENNTVDALFDVMVSCIECVVVGDEVQNLDDYSAEEIKQFVENLPGKAINDLKFFFESMPTLSYDLEYQNSEGETKRMVLEGTQTFFL